MSDVYFPPGASSQRFSVSDTAMLVFYSEESGEEKTTPSFHVGMKDLGIEP